MIAALRLFLAATLLALPLWVASTMPAHGCTYSLRDNIGSADLVAIGTVGEMLILPPESVEHPEQLQDRMPIEIKFAVSEYVKGSGPSTLLIYRPAVAFETDDAGRITSVRDSYTDCGTTISAGSQFIGLFWKSDSLRYDFQAAGLNDEQSKQYVLDVLRSSPAQPDGLPPTGSGPTQRHGVPIVPLAAASAVAGVALLANGWLVVQRRR